jgi:hypothetical protein
LIPAKPEAQCPGRQRDGRLTFFSPDIRIKCTLAPFPAIHDGEVLTALTDGLLANAIDRPSLSLVVWDLFRIRFGNALLRIDAADSVIAGGDCSHKCHVDSAAVDGWI